MSVPIAFFRNGANDFFFLFYDLFLLVPFTSRSRKKTTTDHMKTTHGRKKKGRNFFIMSVRNVFGVSIRHPLYDVDEILLEEDPCHLTVSHPGFLMREQLAAFVSGSSIISTPGITASAARERAAAGQQQQQQQPEQTRDLEERSVIQVPLWVARALVPRLHAKMESPKVFDRASLLDFKSDPFAPLVADTKGARYFDYGVAVSAFLPPNESKRVREAALELYKKRYANVVLEGLKKGTTGTHDTRMRAKLTTREQAVYLGVAQDVQERTAWRRWLY